MLIRQAERTRGVVLRGLFSGKRTFGSSARGGGCACGRGVGARGGFVAQLWQ
uniref:Uncharacterized protein n=1 Tax=Siphoviridae sp. ctR0j7 TaxID=2823580 RepID=A0A8S5LI37_9CAUD|nr:MAG TPA: hypothetical protein [Siphoviridae sp. ctR0j7]DAR50303.1 MAG TPA: hypothetical protein [Caudoviricetes sp.]